MSRQVAVIVGSLRQGSFTRKLAEAAAAAAPAGLSFSYVGIGDLPLFNQDFEDAPPPPWVRFRDEIRAADAVLWATPEYNRSVPAALKNALDVGSRPYGKSVFTGKPAAVIAATPGGLGAFSASQHLRQSLTALNILTLQQPEIYISNVHMLLNEEGVIADEGVKALLAKFGEAFAAWIEKNSEKRAG